MKHKVDKVNNEEEKLKAALALAISNLKKNIMELDNFGGDLRELSYNPETHLHNQNSQDYIYGIEIYACASVLKSELNLFTPSVTTKSFKKFSAIFTEELNRLEKETHSDTTTCETAGIILKNLLIGLTIIGAIIFAAKAVYSLTTKEGFNPHSIFYGTRKAHVQKIHDLRSDLAEIENLIPKPKQANLTIN